jgi:hypothetical protein
MGIIMDREQATALRSRFVSLIEIVLKDPDETTRLQAADKIILLLNAMIERRFFEREVVLPLENIFNKITGAYLYPDGTRTDQELWQAIAGPARVLLRDKLQIIAILVDTISLGSYNHSPKPRYSGKDVLVRDHDSPYSRPKKQFRR